MLFRKILTPVIIFVCLLMCSALLAAEEGKFLSDRHIKNNDVTCADCHNGVKEPKEKASIQPCLDCHGGYDGMIELTQKLKPNPHDSHEGEIECGECHKPHGKSVDYCEQCHAFGLLVP